MQVVFRLLKALVAALLISAPAFAQITNSRGMASVRYAGPAASPDDKARAQGEAKLNAVERHIAETNPAKQRLFDNSRSQLLASVDSLLLTTTVLSETDDPLAKTLTTVVRVEINSGRLENALADASGASPVTGDGPMVAVVFVSRTPSDIRTFSDRVFTRADATADSQGSNSFRNETKEGEKVDSRSVSTSDRADTSTSSSVRNSVSAETGGSVTRTADKVEWTVSSSEDVDQQMTGIFANAGLEVVPSEFIDGLDLDAARQDFGEGDDLDAATLRAMAAAVKGSDIPYLILGTLDEGLADTDPVSGSSRVYVKVKARIYELTRAFPRVLSAVEPTEYAGLGPNPSVARTNALKLSASEVAKKLVDEITVKGVR